MLTIKRNLAKITYVHDRIFTFDFGRFKINQYAVKVAYILCASNEENIDITLRLVFGRIYKINIILKTCGYFLTKIEQYMLKSHM